MNFTKPKISKKKIVIFSVFIVLATIFWFLNALNREYTTKISYPVEFYNIPKNISPAVSVPENLSINIKAYGFEILWKMGVSKPLKINVEKFAEKDKSDKSKLLINSSRFKNELFPNLNNIEIISIDPEIIVFSSKNLKSKKVPVKMNISYTTQSLFMISGTPGIYPDSILIYGTEKNISKTDFVETIYKKYNDLNDTLKTNIPIKKIDNISFEKETVKLFVPVEKFTENTTKVNIKVINCPDSLRLLTFPKEVKLTYKVTLSRYKSINPGDFELSVDFKDTESGNDEKIKINLIKSPEGIEHIILFPDYAEYIIEKQNI